MRILFLTSQYPATDINEKMTDVAHSFTKEWVKEGQEVIVVHNMTTFPRFVCWGLRLFKKFLERKSGLSFVSRVLPETDYIMDGVRVYRRNIFKLLPRRKFSTKAYTSQKRKILNILENLHYHPDVIVSHWWTPQLRLTCELKEIYDCKAAIVAHGVGPFLDKEYGPSFQDYLDRIDLFGFRSVAVRNRCNDRYHLELRPYFYCYSGIPKSFTGKPSRKIKQIKEFTFVGNLIDRKYPEAIIKALQSKKEDEIHINYVGIGPMLDKLKSLVKEYGMNDIVTFHGRVSRNEVGQILSHTDCFIMISRWEAFGLVYLEAMANGCITIASKGDGVDGIINDGENGFLSEPGDWEKLSSKIDHISNLSEQRLTGISHRGQETANRMTDNQVAKDYLDALKSCYNRSTH